MFSGKSLRLTGGVDGNAGLIYNHEFEYEQAVERSVHLYSGIKIEETDCEARPIFQMLVDIHSAWIAGNGINIDSDNPRNLEWIDQFCKFNRVESDLFPEIVTALALESKALVRLKALKEQKQVKAQLLRWYNYRYTVSDDLKEADFGEDRDGNEVKYNEGQFVFFHTGSGYGNPNYPYPISASAYPYIHNVAIAMQDWRLLNHKFGLAVPYFETENWEDANEINENLRGKKWKIGTTVAAKAKASYLVPPADAAANIDKEIDKNLQFISGFFGVPIHVMGFISLFGTKAGAEAMDEMVNVRTLKLRSMCEAKFRELISDAMVMHNKQFSDTLDPNDVQVSIPPATLEAIGDIVRDWIPIYERDLVSGETITEKLPGIDMKREKERLEKQREQKRKEREERSSTLGMSLLGGNGE